MNTFRKIGGDLLRTFVPLPLRLSQDSLIRPQEKRRMLLDLPVRAGGSPCRGLRVLFWVPGGMPSMLSIEGTIATALRLRGADVCMVTCDGVLAGCVAKSILEEPDMSTWDRRCPGCSSACGSVVSSFGLPHRTIGSFVSPGRIAELRERARSVPAAELGSFRYCDVEVGRYARSAAIRYLRGLPLEDRTEVLREHLFSALVSTEAARNAIDLLRPDRVFMSHGIYVDYGPCLALSVRRGIPVTGYMTSYLSNHYYLNTISDTLHLDFHQISDREWEARKSSPLSAEESRLLDGFLSDRYLKRASFDIPYIAAASSREEIHRRLELRGDRPVWAVFTHLMWDAAFDYSAMAFETGEQWLEETILQAIRVPEVQWLVRIHPAEAHEPQAYTVGQWLAKRFPNLPQHVKVIPADSNISSFSLYPLLSGGVTVYGTAGLELALFGKPVIVAGSVHYGRKGFTWDGATPAEYVELLRRASALPPLSEEQKSLASQYAYSYFIEREIPLSMIRKGYRGWGPLDLTRARSLLPGREAAVDLICDRIARGGDFILQRGT